MSGGSVEFLNIGEADESPLGFWVRFDGTDESDPLASEVLQAGDGCGVLRYGVAEVFSGIIDDAIVFYLFLRAVYF